MDSSAVRPTHGGADNLGAHCGGVVVGVQSDAGDCLARCIYSDDGVVDGLAVVALTERNAREDEVLRMRAAGADVGEPVVARDVVDGPGLTTVLEVDSDDARIRCVVTLYEVAGLHGSPVAVKHHAVAGVYLVSHGDRVRVGPTKVQVDRAAGDARLAGGWRNRGVTGLDSFGVLGAGHTDDTSVAVGPVRGSSRSFRRAVSNRSW